MNRRDLSNDWVLETKLEFCLDIVSQKFKPLTENSLRQIAQTRPNSISRHFLSKQFEAKE